MQNSFSGWNNACIASEFVIGLNTSTLRFIVDAVDVASVKTLTVCVTGATSMLVVSPATDKLVTAGLTVIVAVLSDAETLVTSLVTVTVVSPVTFIVVTFSVTETATIA
jgi:hypothetical protein